MATAGEMKALKKRLINALLYGPVQVVSYSYNGIRINHADFKRVATAISKNAVHVIVGNVPPDAAAMYVVSGDGENTFFVPKMSYGSVNHEKASIAHEAVHCILDIRKTVVPAITTEVMAYITTGILHMYFAISPRQGKDNLRDDVFMAANKVASIVVDEKRRALDATMPELQELAAAIQNHPNYSMTLGSTFSWGEDGVEGA